MLSNFDGDKNIKGKDIKHEKKLNPEIDKYITLNNDIFTFLTKIQL